MVTTPCLRFIFRIPHSLSEVHRWSIELELHVAVELTSIDLVRLQSRESPNSISSRVAEFSTLPTTDTDCPCF
jgi:hypothetical protein